ncbi:VOC family protein [Albibacterium profundi]|uniref:VOC family protein n=1 Tax=Albibacterium profundi TaxID=3134906 RepID=A0ABV5CD22_9SPHI
MAPQPSKIWADYPIKDIHKSKEFYTKLGFTVNESVHDGDSFLSLNIGDSGFILNLFQTSRFEKAVKTKVADQGNEVNFSISAESKEEVLEWEKALDSIGADIISRPEQMKEGWWVMRFADPDGHRWVVLNM